MSSKDEILIKITPKQNKFVKALISGMSQRQAYKFAYNAKNMKNETIDKRASELFKKTNIQFIYNEMIEHSKREAISNISNINNDIIIKIEKCKKENESIIEFIENAILKSLPKEVLTQEELKKINRRKNINYNTRYAILERAGFKCQCCGIKPLKDNNVILHIDHIIPQSLGGSDETDNLQVLCNKCNISKQNRFIVNHNIGWEYEANLG